VSLPPFVQPGPLTTAAFVIVVLFVIAAGAAGVQVARRSPRATAAFIAGALLWLAATGIWVAAGGTRAGTAGMMAFFVISNGMALLVAFSPIGRSLAMGVPFGALVAFQGFRLPLELILHTWAEGGTIPETMTWSGSNLDILSGVVAVMAAPFARHRVVAWAANLVGFALLLNVARVALLSAPTPFGWNVEPPLMLVMYMPYAWIAPICVGGALCGHVILTRALVARPDAGKTA
jgi:hypothetical protein